MEVPTSLYGQNKDVKAHARRMVTALKEGQPLADAVGGEMADTGGRDGLLMMDASPTGAYVGAFHCYLPFRTVYDALGETLPDEIEDKVFREGLETAWGVLGLLGRNNFPWVRAEERHQPFLEAVLRFWDELCAEGDRYSTGANDGKALWDVPNSLHYVLARRGAPQGALNSPLPSGGLKEVVAALRE